MKREKRIASERGLIGYAKKLDPAGFELRQSGPNTFDIMAPDPRDIVVDLLAHILEIAEAEIELDGKTRDQWPAILALKTVADGPYNAARILRNLERLKQFIDAGADRQTLEAIRQALAIGLDFSTLNLVREERGIVAHEKAKEGARHGGKKRAAEFSGARGEIVAAMEPLIAKGQSITNAARIVHRNGVGQSLEANRQTWYRTRRTKL